MLTHLDLLRVRERWRIATRYRPGAREPDLVDGGGQLVALASPPIERQVRLAELLLRCGVQLDEVPADETAFIARLEGLLGRRVDAVSRGPCATDVALLSVGGRPLSMR